jgi:cell division protein FtsN
MVMKKLLFAVAVFMFVCGGAIQTIAQEPVKNPTEQKKDSTGQEKPAPEEPKKEVPAEEPAPAEQPAEQPAE